MVTDARPLSPWAEASHTVRKHTTWFARPVDTAAMALATDPSWPGSSRPPVNQLSRRRRASCSSTTPTPEKPGGVFMLPG